MKGLGVVRSRAAAGLLGFLAIGRVGGAAFPVVFVVCLAHARGYAGAATAEAITVAVSCATMPLRARVVDKWGARRALPIQMAAYVTTLIGLSLAIVHVQSLALITLLSVLASVASPSIDSAVRSSWRAVAADDQQLSVLHTMDSVIEEAGYLVGPVIASALMLGLGYRWTPLLLAVAISLNNLAAMANRAIRDSLFADKSPDEPESAPTAPDRSRGRAATVLELVFGPIVQRDLREIVTPIVLMGGSFGVLAICLPKLAAQHGSMASSGFLTALISVGGLVGGLLFGVFGTRGTARIRQGVIGVVFGAPIALLALTSSPWTVAPILLVAGLAVTPLYINSYLLIDAIIVQRVKNEANSWVPVANNVGYTIGISLGGILLTKSDLAGALTAAAGFGLLLVCLSLRGLFSRGPRAAAVQGALQQESTP